jgi:ABC-type lipoprotein release transport system permease subunit
MIGTIIRLGLLDLWMRRRTGLVMALVTAIPLMSTLLLEAYRTGLVTTYSDADPAFLIVQSSGSLGEFYGSRLPSQLAGELVANGASLVVPEIHTITGATPASAILLRGIPLDSYTQVEDFSVLTGRPLQPGEPSRRVMVGVRLAEKYSLVPGSLLDLRGRPFQVVGVFSVGTYADHEAWVSLEDAQALLGWGSDVSVYVIPAGEKLHPGDMLSAGASIVQKGDSSSNSLAELAPLLQLIKTVTISLGIAAALALANLLLRLAWQQRRDLTILRSLGFGRWTLMGYLLVQGTIIVALGFGVGFLGAFILGKFTATRTAGISIRAVFSMGVLLSSLAFAAVLTVLGTALPALQLSRVSLAGLLRNE